MKSFKIRDLFTGEIKQIGKPRQDKQNSNCRCHHPHFIRGRCNYRTCRHDKDNHYKLLADRFIEALKHDDDVLGRDERFLTNVEAEIAKHPEQFKEVGELIAFVNQGKATCNCGEKIRREDLRYFLREHDNGLIIPFVDYRVWVYSHCANCGFDFNHEKIMRQKANCIPHRR